MGLSWEALGAQNGVKEGGGHWPKTVFFLDCVTIIGFFCVFLDLRSILKGLGRVWEGLERVWGGFWKGFKGGAIIFYIDFYNFCRFRGAT